MQNNIGLLVHLFLKLYFTYLEFWHIHGCVLKVYKITLEQASGILSRVFFILLTADLLETVYTCFIIYNVCCRKRTALMWCIHDYCGLNRSHIKDTFPKLRKVARPWELWCSFTDFKHVCAMCMNIFFTCSSRHHIRQNVVLVLIGY